MPTDLGSVGSIVAEKRCPKCGEVKPRSEWGNNSSSHDGMPSYCKPCYNEWSRNNRNNNPTRQKELRRRAHLKFNYRMSTAAYLDMLQKQDGKCVICKTIKDILHVDHDHVTGKVRGLLCGECNLGIGKLKDSALVVLNAYKYLIGDRECHKIWGQREAQ